MKQRFQLLLAQGLGVGRIPKAPGTFGSLLGIALFLVLIAPGNGWFYALGTAATAGLSVWLCDAAEKILGQKDPGSVVIDEIAAIPLCFAAWVVIQCARTGALPEPAWFLQAKALPLTFGIFAAFRFFDIVKPWPVRQSQALPGGWGVTIDDLLAAGYVNLATVIVYLAAR